MEFEEEFSKWVLGCLVMIGKWWNMIERYWIYRIIDNGQRWLVGDWR